MSYIFVNLVDIEDQFKLQDRAINECKVIKEVNIGEQNLNFIISNSNGKNIFKNIYNRYKTKRYERNLKKCCVGLKSEQKNYFILSKTILQNTNQRIYITDFLTNLGYIEYEYKGEYKNNIEKHINVYTRSKNIENVTAKCVLVYNKLASLDGVFLSNLLENHKIVDIYSEIEPAKYVNRKLNEYNKLEGTTISILKLTKKSLKEYNIVIFVDKNKEHFKKLRLDKETCVIDLTKLDEDKLDKNYLVVKDMLENNKLIETIIKRLYSVYGNNIVASIITQIT